MSLNLARFKKAELIWMASNRCQHRHTYLAHLECFVRDHPNTKRTGYLDIESSNLQADFGIVLSWGIKKDGVDEILHDVLTEKDIKTYKQGQEDYRVVTNCVDALNEFDCIVTHYGDSWRFDVPFLRTRAVSMGIPFPGYGSIVQRDTYPILKAKFRLSRNRQETAVRELLGTTEKNHIVGWRWRAAVRGDKESLAYVLDHNMRDVRDLERLWKAINNFSAQRATSI